MTSKTAAGFVRVALPTGLDQEFTYRVPDPLPVPPPGCRVIVPFGRQRLTGFVVNVLDAPDIAEAQLRNVAEVLDQEAALSPELLKLAAFVAEYYLAPLGEVLRTMHPGGSAPSRRARLTAAGELALAGIARGARQHAALVALSRSADGLGTTALARKLGKNGSVTLRDMEERGWVEIVAGRPGGDVAEATVLAYRLAPEAPLISAPVRSASLGERARNLLAETPESLSVAEIAEALGANVSSLRAALKRLEGLGVVTRESRSVARVPHAPPADPAVKGHAARVLTPGQARALEESVALLDSARFGVLLIEGVTGSGKTEVYLRAVEHAITLGRTALYLVPEIAITPLLLRTLRSRFEGRVAILHSQLSEGERRDERMRAAAGEVDVVVGARSAVFAPIPRLGIIVVDEEHEASYKQDSVPRYHGRDVAVMRGRIEDAAVLLGSATPSLESARNAETGRHGHVILPERAGGALPATVELIDMRAEWKVTKGAPVSRALRQGIDQTLAAGRQVMLLLNRRGWADFVLCRECGEPERCERCSVSLTVHLKSKSILCHYCDFRRDIPQRCRKCAGEFLQNIGRGTEQLEEELIQMLPDVPIARLDADVARRKGAVGEILADFEAGRTRILLGTQMIAKGHDFAGVTLVGVLQADRALWLPDFRAAERTFQLLTQVAGRAGRRQDPGRVIVQTFSPEHPAMALAQTQDYRRFYAYESGTREALGYPPFRRLAALLVSGPERDEAEDHARRLAEALRSSGIPDLRVLGPAPAPLQRLKERWRFHVLVKSEERLSGQRAIRAALHAVEARDPLRVDVDIDPQALL